MNMSSKTETRALAALDDPRWTALRARDAAADGQFFYSVRTTGVYCKPSCAARPARPENIAFHATAAEAEAAGFRPCRRCKPDQPPLAQRQAALVAELCRFIEQAPNPPSLDVLAERVALSPHHLHRLFKAQTGLTPKAYADAHKARRLRELLQEYGSVTDALYGAGYGASSRFYAQADALLGMAPRRYRDGGAAAEIRFALGQCALGAILVAQSERGLCAISLGDDAEALLRELQDRFPKARLIGGDAGFEQLVARVVGFVEAPGVGLDLPLDVRGTAFQQRVWQALREIPPGRTASYSEIAALIGAPRAVRAVASACAANTLAVAIPCHRVLRQDGSPGGYRWGVERKRELLAREAKP
ncbi:bifunctional DNA-binding transcriptional regulator/O6-methylguanine-DNA methyltransferase Ada [Paucibacter sp. XJ19-41]|uniref:bifunctional DNA-binding transcriptional regulator/O6-methylguanine-DNA methyltransferase Ada n=1 Tax=Paucibacter sp. XJ19-41 TaxID=2927824 RepID=UPI00234AC023|nr:bifunctional DNA-binding transcriptional regulator/O6-methylguanine-DNA methyltransferase Ada [Paucibacter sp. XJ19-41]MDC6169349.1 bifunctional DNA-binding transcriptional regulator/O6-methylguanine-DNA methyltransferase Ada [Paucibacter sp. XJ19-41]